MSEISVPAKAKINFDPHTENYTKHGIEILEDIQSKCPVAWSDHHDGFWLFTTYADVVEGLSLYQSYSSEHDLPEEVTGFPQTGSGFRGTAIPQHTGYRYIPTEADPPLSSDVRKIYNPFFTPEAAAAHEPQLIKAVQVALDAVIESGKIEFGEDLAKPVPYRLALSIVGIDPDDWKIFAVGEGTLRYLPTDPQYPYEGLKIARDYVLAHVAERRRTPKNDVTSALIAGQVMGRSLTDPQIATILNGLVFGGSHTVTATLLAALVWLDDKPEMRARLLSEDRLMMSGIDEFIRWATPFPNSGRNVTKDIEKNGQHLKRGDRVMMSMAAANRDPHKFECPHDVRLDRKNAMQHLSFGAGGHRCAGATLARLELKVLLREILTRLPDYRIDHTGIIGMERTGYLNTLISVPARFTPGVRYG